MRIVIALGGNALIRRSDPMTTEVQRKNIEIAAQAIAPLAAEHSIVVVHGNGPQVGLLSLQADVVPRRRAVPARRARCGHPGHDRLPDPAGTRSLLPPECQVATLLTMIVVDPDDPAFASPTKFVGPVYAKDAADTLAAEKGWAFRQDGTAWRRVVPSPEPRTIVEIQPITWLLDRGAVVICAGGGGIPMMHPADGGPAPCSASRRSSTRTSRANCSPRTWARTCSSWPPTWTASTSTGAPRSSAGWARSPPEELADHPVRGRVDGPEGQGGRELRHEDRQAGRHRRRWTTSPRSWPERPAPTWSAESRRPSRVARTSGNGAAGQPAPRSNASTCARPRSSVSGRWWARGSSRCSARPARSRARRCGCRSSSPGWSPCCRATLRQARRALPDGRRAARICGEGVRRRPFHRHHRVADLLGECHRDRDGRGLVRQLRQRHGRRRRTRPGQGLRGADHHRDDRREHHRVPAGRAGADRHRLHRARHPRPCSRSSRSST